MEAYLEGSMTPVYFGSALNNFGVRELLQGVADMAPPPRPQPTESRQVQPTEDKVSGFVFKIQANMDPNHRDRIAFLRLCSGHFKRGAKLKHSRSGKTSTCTTRCCSWRATASWPRRPGRATSSAFPTTATSTSAMR